MTENQFTIINSFKNNYDALDVIGGENILCFEEVMKINWKDLTKDLMEDNKVDEVIKMAKERFKAICFIIGANKSQFGILKIILNIIYFLIIRSANIIDLIYDKIQNIFINKKRPQRGNV